MPYHRYVRLCVWLVIVCITPKLAVSQVSQNPVVDTWESAVLGPPEEFVQLRDTLTELEYMVETDQIALSSQRFAQLIERVEFGQRRLAAAVDTESRLNKERNDSQRRMAEERMAELISELKINESDSAKLSLQIKLPKSALEQMSRKIGEAIIANRLRELESTALLEALKTQAKTQQRSPLHDSKMMLAERKFALATKRLAQARELSERNLVSKQEVDELELSELEAETNLNQVKNGSGFPDSISQKITDASTNQIVSARMQKLLTNESTLLNEQLGKASAIARVNSDIEQLRNQIWELRTELSRFNHRSRLEDKNLLRARMLLSQVDRTLKKVRSLKEEREEGKSK